MTLSESCKHLNGKIIKVGARSGFIYCGRVDSSIYDDFDRITATCLEPLAKQLEKKLKAKAAFDDIWDKQFEEMMSRLKENHSNIPPALFSKYYDRFQDLRDEAWNNLMQEIWDLQNQIDSFIPIGNREVVEIRDSFYDADKILIIDGDEQGKHWTVSDYKKGDC